MYAIDVHTHVFPDQVAEKAVASLSYAAKARAYGTGTIRDLQEKMDKADVKKSVLAAIATRIPQVHSINNWLLSQRNDRFIPFAAIHPDDPDRFKEILRVKELGFKGVKLHPNYQEFYPDEPRIIDLVRAIADAGLILLLHGGVDWAYEEVKASPRRIASLMEAVPSLTLIIAHFGGFERWLEVETTLAGSSAFFDISFTLPFIKEEDFLRIARKHGVHRLLFGSDYPWADPGEQRALLDQYHLSEGEKEAILHLNAEKLLDLSASP
jgi:hypothetical protein